MCLETGPVTRSRSACRGLATKRMPRPSRLYSGLLSACISSSQPLQEPASTARMQSARPRTARMRACSASRSRSDSAVGGGGSVAIPTTAIWRKVFSIFSSRLEIVAAVGQVERLIDEREIGHDVAENGVLECRPVLPGGIVGMTAADAATLTSLQRYEHRTPPAFDEP